MEAAFATADEYLAKYDTDMDEERLEEWLADASDLMRSEMSAASVGFEDPGEDFARTLMSVCRDMVRRAIGDDGEDALDVPFGTTQVNMSGGSYSRGYSFSNPNDDLFLTASERKRLGIGLERACVLSPYGGGDG